MTSRDQRERERAIRENTRPRCESCGGSFWLPSGFVRHAVDCPKLQDEEAAALRDVRAPFPIRETS